MSEVQKKGEIIMTYLNNQYHDRGMKKWAGFFLSEHTAEQEKIQKGLAHINPQKFQMSEQEISEVLQLAIVKNKPVAIQIEAIDSDGNYYDLNFRSRKSWVKLYVCCFNLLLIRYLDNWMHKKNTSLFGIV